MNDKKLYRSLIDRKFLGVCGGIAEYLDVDSTLIRLIFVLALFFSCCTFMLAYLLAAAIMPNHP